MGWDGIKNGSLLELAAQEFEVVFTVDRRFADATATVNGQIGIVILQVGSTDFDALAPLMPTVYEAIRDVEPGQVIRVPK